MIKCIIETTSFLNKIALFKDENPIKISVSDPNCPVVGSIYRAEPVKFMPALGGVFLRLDKENIGYLNTSEKKDEYIVKIKREPIDDKKYLLSEEISLEGVSVIYIPSKNEFALSNKIREDEHTQSKISEIQKFTDISGIIFRSSFLDFDNEFIINEIKTLKEKYDKILDKSLINTERLLYTKEFWKIFFDNLHEKQIDMLVCSDKVLLEEIIKYLKKRVEIKNTSLNKTDAIDVKTVCKNKFAYGQISLTLEETEAFTIFDVNSGYQGKFSNKEDTVLDVNLQASRKIFDLINLRNIGGKICIDYIYMKNRKNRDKLISEIKKLCLAENVKTGFKDMTSTGIVELIRKKDGESLRRRLFVSDGYLTYKKENLIFDEIENKLKLDITHREFKKISVYLPEYVKNFKFAEDILKKKYAVDINLKSRTRELKYDELKFEYE